MAALESSVVVRRQRKLLAIVLTWALVSTAGLVATRWIKSPAQLAAETKPPPATVLTAPVEYRKLTETLIARGTVSAARTVDFTPTSAFGAEDLVVTRVPKDRGQTFGAGQVVIEVSGRPLIALPGDFPAYRDFRDGQRGPDVRQLQKALRSLGFHSVKISATFDAATRAAVERLYRARGYDAPTSEPTKGASGLVTLPKSEVMFLPAFPGRVIAIGASVGDRVAEGPLITVSSGVLAVQGRINPSEGGLIRAGMPVSITSEGLDKTAEGTVSNVGDVSTDSKTGERYMPIRITASRPLDARFDGQEVKLTVESASSNSAVLVVPLAAVYSGADGATYVDVLVAAAHERRIAVTVGITALGFAQVTPRDGSLAPGDRVVVGR